MKKCVFLLVALALLTMCWTGCTDKKPVANDSTAVDTMADTTATDTMEQIIADTPMPKAADELFDDFIFNFAANRKLQYKRVQFPLKVYNGSHVDSLTKGQWKMEHFFMRQGYYTLIFDNVRQMNVVKDTSINIRIGDLLVIHDNAKLASCLNRVRLLDAVEAFRDRLEVLEALYVVVE